MVPLLNNQYFLEISLVVVAVAYRVALAVASFDQVVVVVASYLVVLAYSCWVVAYYY